MRLNNWNESEAARAERTWGHLTPSYTLDMFNFTIDRGNSYLDLGCGFGRFLNYLTEKVPNPNYIGYDSSQFMLRRLNESFPQFSKSIFLRDVTQPITHKQQSVIASALFIHLTLQEQEQILTNILSIQPATFTFDINCPSEAELDRLKIKQSESYERIMSPGFRMTWQSHYEMTKKIISLCKNYTLTVKFYDLKPNKHKVVYFLERK